ncbi:MAG: ABC transporter ATP-binding protein [Anaerolineae bacterium]|nr:ABC transporter ATP-binding protein [Anaerolineae bacterium]
MNEPILIAEHLQITFASANSHLEALAEASFAVMPNEFICIIGPSGCGKSTLLRILGGLVQPTGGRVLLEGKPLTKPQRRIGFVFQHATLMPWRSALRNVMLPLEIQGIPREEAKRRALELLELVGLADFAESLPRDLSGGMRQRVALARALVYDPDVLLLDEPFGALDALTRERMNWELLRIWQKRRKTVVMITHDIQEAIFLSDRVLTMSPRPGRIEKEVLIDIPRPRSLDALYTPRFLELTRLLRSSLRWTS